MWAIYIQLMAERMAIAIEQIRLGGGNVERAQQRGAQLLKELETLKIEPEEDRIVTENKEENKEDVDMTHVKKHDGKDQDKPGTSA